ncbi:hypothetical protein K474DRAFT_938553 [Panus rudis PR-1116 ss-1]|nr:hypothetical protein K474DRAFT_938553 [Panus rudis PR-1116 ss-1]
MSTNIDMTLPQEVIDYIIDFLHDDKASLLQCSLVHRTWLDASYHHIFKELDIVVPSAESEDAHKITKFAEFLQAEPRMAASVRSLELVSHDCMHPIPSYQNADDGGRSILDIADISVILRCLPRIQSLTLCGLVIMVGNRPFDSQFKKELKQLQLLDVVTQKNAPLTPPHSSSIVNLLSLFSRVEELVIGVLRPDVLNWSRTFGNKDIELSESMAGLTLASEPLLVTNINIVGVYMSSTVFPVLRRAVSTSQLETVYWEAAPDLLDEFIREFLSDSRNTCLKELAIGFLPANPSEYRLQTLRKSFASLPAFSSLPSFQLTVHGTQPEFPSPDRTVIELLSGLSPQSITKLSICFRMSSKGFDDFPLAKLDWALMMHAIARFPDLKTVDIGLVLFGWGGHPAHGFGDPPSDWRDIFTKMLHAEISRQIGDATTAIQPGLCTTSSKGMYTYLEHWVTLSVTPFRSLKV